MVSKIMLLRSMLYVPGNNVRMIIKAVTLSSDAIILDLEDAVSLSDKETARIIVRDSIEAVKLSSSQLFVRVNGFATNLIAEDLKLVVSKGLDGIMLPKSQAKSEVVELDDMLEKTEKASKLKPETLKVIPLIETAKGVINVHEIASASKRVVAVAFGAGDYCRDLGRDVSHLSSEQTELLYARSQIINGSRAAGVQAIDTPFLGLLTNREGFRKETVLALGLGFKGKQVVHPAQIEFVNNIFTPPQDATKYAKRLIKSFEEAQAQGLGATSFEGRMIDYMSYKQAKDLLSFAKSIVEKKKRAQQVPSTMDLFQILCTHSDIL